MDDQLVKIGWSKKAKKEYQHKAPRYVVDLLVKRLLQMTTPDKVFTTEELFPLRNETDDMEIPSYQAYLALAWLRSFGAVRQHGRQGYSMVPTQGVISIVDRAWAGLPEYR